jgi:hypothetical protein
MMLPDGNRQIATTTASDIAYATDLSIACRRLAVFRDRRPAGRAWTGGIAQSKYRSGHSGLYGVMAAVDRCWGLPRTRPMTNLSP